MTYIDDFIKKEEAKMSRFDKLFGNYPRVRSTKFLTGSIQPGQLGEKKVIKPSLWNKIVAIIILPIPGIMWIALLILLLNFRSPFLVILFAFLFVNFMLYLLLFNTFFNKKYNYTITVDGEGISIDSNRFYWTDIAETAIMSRREGKRTNYYLLIFNKDTTLKKCDLFNFGISDGKLSRVIEYYKTAYAK